MAWKIKLTLRMLVPLEPDGKIYMTCTSIFNPGPGILSKEECGKLRKDYEALRKFWFDEGIRGVVLGVDQSRKYKARDVIKGWPCGKSTLTAYSAFNSLLKTILSYKNEDLANRFIAEDYSEKEYHEKQQKMVDEYRKKLY